MKIETTYINTPITSNEIEVVTKSLPTKNTSGANGINHY
jgi:hypothetical protein